MNESILENITLSKNGGGYTMEQVHEAAKKANAHEFILANEDGYPHILHLHHHLLLLSLFLIQTSQFLLLFFPSCPSFSFVFCDDEEIQYTCGRKWIPTEWRPKTKVG